MCLRYTGDWDFISSVHLWNNHKLDNDMKTIFYPPQHITEVGDIIYNSPPPERIVIDPKYLATEIKERLDDNGHYHIELGDDKVTIDIELDCEWQYFDHPYAKDGVSIYNIEEIHNALSTNPTKERTSIIEW